MSEPTAYPFGLKPTDAPRVHLLLGFYSGKTGAGKQEIIIQGDGNVSLYYSKSAEDKTPTTRRGTLNLAAFWRLLDLFEGSNFFNLEDLYAGGHDHPHAHARRLLRLTLPDREKTVVLEEPELYVAEQLIGAVRFVAGLALPEAINHRFFPNLS